MPDKHRMARALVIPSRAMLFLIALVWSGFALLSGTGAEQDVSFRQNLPNAAPWAGLGIAVLISFKWPGMGGALVLLLGLASIPFFRAFTSPMVLFGVSLPIIFLGAMLLVGALLASD